MLSFAQLFVKISLMMGFPIVIIAHYPNIPTNLHLDTFLQIFPDCLIHLINYEGIDFVSPKTSFNIPLILSRYKVINLTNKTTNTYQSLFIKHNLKNIDNFHSETSQIKRIDLTTKVKNWLCTVTLFVYPPNSTNSQYIYYNNDTNSYMLAIPRPDINFGVHTPDLDSRTAYYYQSKPLQNYCVAVVPPLETHLTPWLQALSNLTNDDPETPYNEFQFYTDLLVLHTSVIESDYQTLLFPYSVKTTGPIYYLCKYCNWCDLYTPVQLPENISSRTQLDLKIKSYKTSPSLWRVYHPWVDTIWVEKYTKTFHDLKGHRLSFPKHQVHPNDTEYASSYLNQALSHIILQNHSFTTRDMNDSLPYACKCVPYLLKNKLLFPVLIYTEGPQTDFLIPEELHPFRFVSCGGQPRTVNVLSFSSFYSAFDVWTWYLILVLYFFLMLLISSVKSWSDVLLTSYAILVEQTQDRCTRFKQRWSHLFAYGSLIVSGILLSNGYKGDNITRLTLPILPIPYERLEDLLENNFTFYQSSERRNSLDWSFNVTSPPMMSKAKQKNLLQSVKAINGSLIIDMLKLCGEKTGIAVFEPEEKVFLHAAILRNYSHIDWEDVGIGVELYSGVWRGLKVVNNVDPGVPQRVSWLYETGVITQWLDMWSLRMVYHGDLHWAKNDVERKLIEERNKIDKEWSTSLVLHGSILTLFVGLGGSWVVGIGCFVGEVVVRVSNCKKTRCCNGVL